MAIDKGLQGIEQEKIKRLKKNAAWQREWRKAHPEKVEEYERKARPGITKRQREKRNRNAVKGLCRCGRVREGENFKNCRTCRERVKVCYKKNQTKRRDQFLHTVNGYFRVSKRRYPDDGKCELNGENGKRLVYHHWDEEDRGKGVWLCNMCHLFVGTVDKGWHLGMADKYLKLKEEINNG